MTKSIIKPALRFFIIVILLQCVRTYIDVSLDIATSSSDLAFNMPITISGQKYQIGLSLQNKEEYVVSPSSLKHKGKTQKTHSNGALKAQMHVSSLQGYTLQGWRRFFMEIVLFEDSKYSHTINFNLTGVKQIDKFVPLTNGLMTLGPKISQNHIYNLIKTQTKDYFKQDVVSFYTAPGSKEIKMQLGGYEEQNARGYKNGVRFYQKSIEVSDNGNQWLLPVNKLTIAKEKGNKWNCYIIPNSQMRPKLSIQSQFVVLPDTLREDLETSFESEDIQCSFTTTSFQLQCSNISSIDEALTFLSFAIDQNITLNISLYDLRDQYNSKDKITSFFIKLAPISDIQIGAPLLRGYYLSLNMTKPSILFSPINRFTPQITSVSILRFLICFLIFMICACICVIIWQQLSNPQKIRRFSRQKDGVRLVTYQRPNEFDQDG